VFLHGIQTYIYVDVFVNEIDITTIFSHQRLKAYPLSLSFQQTKNTPIMYFQAFAITFAAVSAVQAVAVPRRSRESACNHYTIIDTRGNGTPQGPSAGFRIMNANIRMQVSGGTTYNTVYPAGVDLNSAPGTDAIVLRFGRLLPRRNCHLRCPPKAHRGFFSRCESRIPHWQPRAPRWPGQQRR
jgi:hypothetical protein